MENVRHIRPVRIKLTTTTDTKELLSQAAALDGSDLAVFVLGAAIEKARKVFNQHTSIALAKERQEALVRLLAHPASPTSEMKQLMQLPDLPSRRA
jgi:uncharacterized protein (DUF1778 family)